MEITNPINETVDLVKEQADFVALMEASIAPDVLKAVEDAYHASDDDKPSVSLNVSCEGTTHV